MNFRDTWLTCETCDRNFVFTVEEQRRLHKTAMGDYVPDQCPTCREIGEEGIKLIGQVKWYSPDKGYGFITKADGSEIFVHRTSLNPGVYILSDGQRVEFEVRQSDKGPEAINVAPLGA
jgi:CspA family cold shock protein